MEARPLPPRPSLEQYKKQAKNLLKACVSTDPRVIHEWVAHWVETYADEEAEVQARLRGMALTQQLRNAAQREEIARIQRRIAESKLVKPDPRLADAQFFVARLHGFDSWSKFAKQVQVLQRRNSQDARFEAAADAIVSGDIQTLEQLLRKDPQLISACSGRTHNAPLLHYVAANGIEGFRQRTPKNIVDIARLLLEAGAEVNAESNAYGGGCTALGLAATSVHTERAGVQEALLQILIDHGADMDKPGVGGNGHTAVEGCLWNGRGRAAAFLASRGAQLSLETAGGTGRIDVVKSFFSEDGKLKSFVKREQLQRGFLWACEYGYQDVVEFLLDHGADLRDQAGTGEAALHWAVVGGKLSILNLLLKHGAPMEELNAYGGTALGQAGWSFVNGDPQIDYMVIFETLLAAGTKIGLSGVATLRRCSGPSRNAVRLPFGVSVRLRRNPQFRSSSVAGATSLADAMNGYFALLSFIDYRSKCSWPLCTWISIRNKSPFGKRLSEEYSGMSRTGSFSRCSADWLLLLASFIRHNRQSL